VAADAEIIETLTTQNVHINTGTKMKKWFLSKNLFFKLMAAGLVSIVLIIFSSLSVSAFFFKNSDHANEIHMSVDKIMVKIHNARFAATHFMLRDLIKKEFYQTGTSGYLEKHAGMIDSLSQDIEWLEGMTKGQRRKDVRHIGQLLNQYNRCFLALVKAYHKRGFKDWGVLGEWRQAIHTVENDVSQMKNIQFVKDLLQLRRFEKDYLLRGEIEYIRRHEHLLQRLNDKVADIKGPTAKVVLKNMANYKIAFKEYIELQAIIGKNDTQGLQGDFAGASSIMEPVIEKIYQDASRASRKARQNFIGATLFIDGFGIVLGAVILFLFARTISMRLVELKGAVLKVGRGRLDTRVKIRSRDEIGVVASAFNKMTKDLDRITVSKDYVEKIIESMADALIVAGPECDIRTVNRATLDLLEYSENELLGKSLHLIMGNDAASESFVTELKTTKTIRNVETRYLTRGGVKIPVLFASAIMRDKKGHILGIVCIAHDYREHKRTDEMLKHSELKLRFLSSQVLASQEQERKRVAMELHDGIGQSLTAIKFCVESSIEDHGKGKKSTGLSSLEQVVPMIQGTIEEVRKIAMDLRPSSLDDLGLAATITWFCRQFQLIYSGIRIEKRVLVNEKNMPENLKTTIFRILQETFNNVAKHSGAELIRLDLIQDETSVTLSIEDNGMGFEIENQNKNALDHGFGLPGLQERAELAGGIFSICSKKEKGTTVQVVWSYRAMSPFPRA